jgi:hypothetical protein
MRPRHEAMLIGLMAVLVILACALQLAMLFDWI